MTALHTIVRALGGAGRSGWLMAWAALFAAWVAPVQAGPVIERLRASGKIVLAHRESSVPFSYLGTEGRPIGYAMDLCLHLADHVRRKLGLKSLVPEFMLVTSSNRIQAIADGQADLECGSTTNNAERRQKVAFTVPHYLTGARYLVRASSRIQDLQDFEGKKLASTKGSTPLKAIDQANRERMLRINLIEVPDHARGVEMVEAGEIDGFAMDDVLLYGLIAGRPEGSKLKVVGKFLTIEPLAIMLSKDDPEFKRIIDDEMKHLIQSREIYPIYERWFQKPVPPRNTSLNLPMSYMLKDFWKYPTDQVPF